MWRSSLPSSHSVSVVSVVLSNTTKDETFSAYRTVYTNITRLISVTDEMVTRFLVGFHDQKH